MVSTGTPAFSLTSGLPWVRPEWQGRCVNKVKSKVITRIQPGSGGLNGRIDEDKVSLYDLQICVLRENMIVIKV